MIENFKKAIHVHHCLFDKIINEKLWETLYFEILLSTNVKIFRPSSESHLSGMDISTSIGKFSNKTAKIIGNYFSVSSYRLTKVTNSRDIGTIENIIREIDSRRNFDFYSILVRKEKCKEIIYSWVSIPAKKSIMNPRKYDWFPTFNKQGIQNGWKTNRRKDCEMRIVFSMSSQLWIKISTTKIEKYIIASHKVERGVKFNFLDLYSLLPIH